MAARGETKRSSFKRKYMGDGSTGKKARIEPALTAMVSRMVAARAPEELKYTNLYTIGSALAGAAPIGVVCNLMVQGITRSTRLSNRVRMKSLELRYDYNIDNGCMNFVHLRCMVFVDKQTNSGGPPFATSPLLGAASTLPGNTDAYQALYNPAYVPSRYKVLYDGSTTLGLEGGVANIGQRSVSKRVLLKIPKSMAEVVFTDSNTGTLSDITKNSVHLVFFSDYVGAGPNAPTCNFATILRFTDA